LWDFRKRINFIFVFLANILFWLATPIFSNTPSEYSIEEATILTVHDAIKNQRLTCTQLVNAYLTRIKKCNLNIKYQPPVNAFTEINPSVLVQAQHIDDIFSKTKSLIGPLHCVPVILKDNIDSYDTTTTAGAFALLGNQPTRDAFLVSQLRKAGAIILGKGGMDELAWGSRNGRVGNAYDPAKSPGGSSSGVAVGVSANFALVGIGTDNSGSVRIPASFNGLVSLRPSTGLVSQQGIFPMGNLDGVAGPITRTIKDLAILLDVIAASDSSDEKTKNIPRVKSYTSFLNVNGLNNKRIGILRHVGKINIFQSMPDDVAEVFKGAFQRMEKHGVTFVDINLPKFNNDRTHNQAGEIQDVDAYFASYPGTRQNFKDICESGRLQNFRNHKQCIEFINSVPKKFGKQYNQVLKLMEMNRTYVEKVMKKNDLDALLMPISKNGIATYDAKVVLTWQASVSSNSGLPSISLIGGYDPKDNMPIGFEIIGKQFGEGNLIEIAYGFEKHSPARKPPKLIEDGGLEHLSIPEINNLISVIGQRTFDQVLKLVTPHKEFSDKLMPENFREIVAHEISQLRPYELVH
jgi:aspartyl-tRNA(Asn)/glutamyl-tRNA(Gln) amidotransferase subunit A